MAHANVEKAPKLPVCHGALDVWTKMNSWKSCRTKSNKQLWRKQLRDVSKDLKKVLKFFSIVLTNNRYKLINTIKQSLEKNLERHSENAAWSGIADQGWR